MLYDTIAAISTPIGIGGISIIRISGDEALNIAKKIFVSATGKDILLSLTHKIYYGNIINPENSKIIDECLLMVMKAPLTYTKEDIIEINCHGGILSAQKILETVLISGARLAEPGEFTKRAFLNGRIDLSQAEAIIDIINSKTNLLHDTSLNQLEGSLSAQITKYRDELLSLIAYIEAAIDYPEHDIEQITYNTIKEKTEELICNIEYLISTSDKGKIIREGIKTVIIGKPNAGKSSLLNSFLNEQRAIVTDIPGTTRDILEEYININGIPLKIIDTAGIRQTDDLIERIGVEKAKKSIESADLLLIVIDASNTLNDEDIEIFNSINDKKYITVINKIDLPKKLDYNLLFDYIRKDSIVEISAKYNQGINIIESKLSTMFFSGKIDINNDVLITNIRHKDALIRANNSLKEVITTIDAGMPEDCMSIDLQKAYTILGEITGQSLDEDIIDKIFSEFCLGK